MPQGKPLRSFGMQKSTISTEFRTFSEHARNVQREKRSSFGGGPYSGGSYQSRYFRAGCGRRKRELVFTTLRKTARPMIRFRTGDIGTVNREKCACGRTHARINITGRLDDMLIVSGVNVFPSDIEYVVRNMEELSGEYRITAITENFTTKFKLEVERALGNQEPKEVLAEKVSARIKARLGVRPREVIVLENGELPRATHKAKRLIDERNGDFNSMPKLSSKIEGFTDSVIRRMTRIANSYGAINLSQGFPDFDPPVELKNALSRVASGSIHQYAVTWGAKNFREALARKQSRFMEYPLTRDANRGDLRQYRSHDGGHDDGLQSGDKVVVFSPFYENYTADAILSGQSLYMCIYDHLDSILMWMNWKKLLNRGPKR